MRSPIDKELVIAFELLFRQVVALYKKYNWPADDTLKELAENRRCIHKRLTMLEDSI